MKKNVLINGALNDIGIALSSTFRSNGYYVYGLDKKEDYNGTCDRSLRFDIHQFVIDAEYRIRFTQIFEEIMPRLDVLIINEQVDLIGEVKEIQLDSWQKSLDVNLTGPLLLYKLFLSKLMESSGAILNIVNLSGLVEQSDRPIFNAPNNALHALAQTMTEDLRGHVIVNSITVNANIEVEHVKRTGMPSDGFFKELGKLAFYLTADNSGYVHGCNFVMNGTPVR